MEEYDSDLYSEIKNYLGEFQVEMKNDSPRRNSRSLSISSAINVFRKKSLDKLTISPVNSNIYEHNIEVPELDKLDATKSKNSCGRCRKLKRKCSRDMPECSSCVSSDKLCIYIPRKSSKITKERSKRNNSVANSICSSSSSSSYGGRSRSNSYDSINLDPLNGRIYSSSYIKPQTPTILPSIFKPIYSPPPTSPIKLPSIQNLLNGIPTEAGIQRETDLHIKQNVRKFSFC